MSSTVVPRDGLNGVNGCAVFLDKQVVRIHEIAVWHYKVTIRTVGQTRTDLSMIMMVAGYNLKRLVYSNRVGIAAFRGPTVPGCRETRPSRQKKTKTVLNRASI